MVKKIEELAGAHPSQAVDQQINGIAAALPGGKQLFSVSHQIIAAHQQPGQKQPDGYQPGGIHPLAGEQVLADAAGDAQQAPPNRVKKAPLTRLDISETSPLFLQIRGGMAQTRQFDIIAKPRPNCKQSAGEG